MTQGFSSTDAHRSTSVTGPEPGRGQMRRQRDLDGADDADGAGGVARIGKCDEQQNSV